MKQHHIPKDPNFQAPKYQNITKTAQNIKETILFGWTFGMLM
jgi:hypothetical protein